MQIILNLSPEIEAKLIRLINYETKREYPESRALKLLEEAIDVALEDYPDDSWDEAAFEDYPDDSWDEAA